MDICDECGAPMEELGTKKNTKLLGCTECYAEKRKFVGEKTCLHEYDDRNGNKCIQCGEPSIHYK